MVAPNSYGIAYSPYNWVVTATAAVTINAGSYLKCFFSGTTCTLNFDATNNSAPLSQIYYRIDGYGPWTKASIASAIACTIPADVIAAPYHLLEMVVKSTSETINRWTLPSNTAVVFTGLTLDAGATVVFPGRLPRSILVLGDSITEAVRTVNETATNDTDKNDAMQGWAFALGRLMGAEVGVVGFGGTGLVTAGSGNVPALTSTYALVYPGQPRAFTPAPDMIVINHGTNDGSNDTSSALLAVLSGLLGATPVTTKIVVMRPFNGTLQATNIQTAVAAVSKTGRVFYLDTAGFLSNSYGIDSINLHPKGANDLGIIGPVLAGKLFPLLNTFQSAKFRTSF